MNQNHYRMLSIERPEVQVVDQRAIDETKELTYHLLKRESLEKRMKSGNK